MATTWFQDGQSWVNDMLEYHAGVTIEYYQGDETTGEIIAVPADVEYEIVGRDGYQTRFLSRDYYVLKSSLSIGTAQVEPRAGDRVVETIGGVEQTFQLLPVGEMPAAKLRSDGLRYVLHTKRVE